MKSERWQTETRISDPAEARRALWAWQDAHQPMVSILVIAAAVMGWLVLLLALWADGRCLRHTERLGGVDHRLLANVGCVVVMADGTMRRP